MPDSNDTIAALATPTGTSAIAVIRISGPDTTRLWLGLHAEAPLPRHMRRLDYHSKNGELVDDVLAVFFPLPHSYTGEDSLEISCHGNPFIAQKILSDLLERGCRAAEPGEFTQRAFLNGRMDLSEAEAVMDLIHARSERALAAANQQLRGALGRRMVGLIDSLLAVLAHVEAYIDFPDEDLPAEDRAHVQREIARLILETERLLATSRYGEMLRDGIKTVIVGKPNVGKSTLLNCLVGKERALVSDEPGTTRDFIEERLIVGPHCLRLIDTAGLNPSPAPLEKLGIHKTLERAAEADLFLFVQEIGDTAAALPEALAHLALDGNTLIVLTKRDLHLTSHQPDRVFNLPAISISAKTGAGIAELITAITQLADRQSGTGPQDTVAINARHAHALTTASDALQSARHNSETNGPVELLANDLRTVLVAYGEISGRVDNERMLDALFATFCIGK